MVRRYSSVLLGLAVVGLVSIPATSLFAEKAKAHGKHMSHLDECAKACADCMRECESCAQHCAHLVSEGKKEHLRTLGTCADCGEFCAAAAKIVSRHGPMAGTVCEGCAKACDSCGAACEKFPDDAHMKRCAKACRDCAKACRAMLQHLSMHQNK
jgi:hypothetical protein